MNVHAHTIYNIGAKVIISCQTTKYKRFFSVQKFEFLTNILSDYGNFYLFAFGCAAAPLPCRGGVGGGVSIFSLTKS